MIALVDQIAHDDGVFHHDVMAISGALKKRHMREERLKNQGFFKAVIIASGAYQKAMTEMKGTDITINATIARIFMQHKALLKRVYGLSGDAIASLVHTGIQTDVMWSVRVSNCFMRHLNECYGIQTPPKKSKK